MVGMEVGVMVACEVKVEKGHKRERQKHFIEFMKNMGCIALFATSSNDLKKEIEEFKNKRLDNKD